MESQRPVLEMRGICKRFGGVQALDQVHFTAFAGQVTALIGENGAGKSTLMNILGGVLQPDAGEIELNGREVVIRSVPDAIRLGIGFIHQELNVLDNLDVAGNIFLGREPHGRAPLKLIDRKKLHDLARPFLQQLGISVPTERLVGDLSLAQRQMVEVAKALAQKARILIMDEPTSRLTTTETRNLLQIMRCLCAEGVALLFISHRLKEVIEIADQVIALKDGRNSGSLSRPDLSRDRMVHLMIGRDIRPAQSPDSARCEAHPPESHLLRVQGLLTRAHPGTEISFSCRRGEILGFGGLVGAGRSEMARALFGIEPPLGGEVRLFDRKLDLRSPRDAMANGISLIPEDRREQGLILGMSVRENFTLPYLSRYSTFGWIRRREERSATSRQCGDFNLVAPSTETPVHHLSGGNQQKVVLGKWLQSKPSVVIFDEPTRGIDVGAKEEIYQLVRNLASRGAAILLISSDLQELISLSDRIAVMREGAITGTLERSEFDEAAVMRLAVDDSIPGSTAFGLGRNGLQQTGHINRE